MRAGDDRAGPAWDEHPWVVQDALVELMPWGRNTYPVLRLDEALADAARAAGTRRVAGTIEGAADGVDWVDVNVGVNRADVIPDAFAYVGKALARRLGVRPGDVVRYRLRPADPDLVPLPDDVESALADAGRLAAFEQQAPAVRRRLLQPVEDAARPETRQQRVAALVRSLAPG